MKDSPLEWAVNLARRVSIALQLTQRVLHAQLLIMQRTPVWVNAALVEHVLLALVGLVQKLMEYGKVQKCVRRVPPGTTSHPFRTKPLAPFVGYAVEERSGIALQTFLIAPIVLR